jgi:mono/diheme cytochrome c family protein
MTVQSHPGGRSAIFAALAGCILGCGAATEGYDPEYRFPPRTDPIVVAIPASDPAGPHPPGQLDSWLLGLRGAGATVLDARAVSESDRSELAAALDAEFGTPAAPKPDSLAPAAVLYKQLCTQCHGAAGDGRGPTSLWVYPPARDFRTGRFKFVSAANGLPTHADLVRILRRGIGGNAMPAFQLLPDADLSRLSDYVQYLGVRGKVERDATVSLLTDGLDEPAAAFVPRTAAKERARWQSAQNAVPDAPGLPAVETPEAFARIRAGAELFRTAGGCVQCHKNYGRDDVYKYDAAGVAVKVANLTLGQHRGGSEPLDLFRRIRLGIPGSNMPAAPTTLTDPQIADLVAFLLALPTPRHLPPDLRTAIYPEAKP